MVLPLIKVAALIIKSVSKPIAKKIKNSAVGNSRIQGMMIGCARFWHRGETRMQIFVGERNTQRKELNEKAAIELGAELASEGFLLVVAVGLLLFESARNSDKEERKKNEMETRLRSMENALSMHRLELNQWRNIYGSLSTSLPSVQLPPLINHHQDDAASSSSSLFTNVVEPNTTTTTTTVTSTPWSSPTILVEPSLSSSSSMPLDYYENRDRMVRLEDKLNAFVNSNIASGILDVSSDLVVGNSVNHGPATSTTTKTL